MKPITNMSMSVVVTAAIALTLGFLASQVSQSNSETVDLVALADDIAESGVDEIIGLDVVVAGIRNDKGKVIVAVFNSANAYEAYDYDRSIAYAEFEAARATRGAIRMSFPNLKSGPYAISLFHDENSNYDLDMQDDYPLEGYGASGARNALHEPTFEEAAVEPGRVIIQMYYL